MVIASGRSSRQVGAMADHIGRALKQAGYHVSSEGEPQCDWVLVDAGDIIVHLFRPEVRAFYNLEKIWARPAETAAAPAPRPQAAPAV
ncbi:iojap-like protein [Magnetospirillum fulvum MGU-K5]|jgi:ribosome-associated protein|uniref:Iojap-like protein n=2 Tax=Magnetospirillum fulvum TaxID=1082 RepID=S9S7S4_MAGFU|nr:iojap-like protein [Magnetospirillum fulvum MGU-K5]